MKKNILLICFCWMTAAFGAKAQNADINLLQNINPQNPGASFFWKTTTNSTYPVSIGVQGGLLIYDYFHSDSSRKQIWLHLSEFALSVVLTDVMKIAFNRPRPYTKYPGLVDPYESSERGLSFPSGHTSLAFNTAAVLSLRFNKWYITLPAYLWAGSVGYSRLYLGEHYPSDLIAGAATGIGSAYLARWLDKKIFHKMHLIKKMDTLQ